MNTSDPFNRVSAKREAEYKALKDHMEDIGIDSKEKAETMRKQSQRNTQALMLAITLACLAIALVWPAWAGIAGVLGGLVVLMLFTTMLRANRLIKRYIQENL